MFSAFEESSEKESDSVAITEETVDEQTSISVEVENLEDSVKAQIESNVTEVSAEETTEVVVSTSENDEEVELTIEVDQETRNISIAEEVLTHEQTCETVVEVLEKEEETVEVGEEITQEDAAEEKQIAVGAEEVETNEEDFEVDMTSSEVIQEEDSVDIDIAEENETVDIDVEFEQKDEEIASLSVTVDEIGVAMEEETVHYKSISVSEIADETDQVDLTFSHLEINLDMFVTADESTEVQITSREDSFEEELDEDLTEPSTVRVVETPSWNTSFVRDEQVKVGEEVTQETATEETELEVGAEEMERSKEDFEVEMTSSEIAQDEESVDIEMESGSQNSDSAADDAMIDMDSFSEETDHTEQFQLKISEDSESATTITNVRDTFEETVFEQG